MTDIYVSSDEPSGSATSVALSIYIEGWQKNYLNLVRISVKAHYMAVVIVSSYVNAHPGKLIVYSKSLAVHSI
jgi:hypothetical protein